MIIFLYNVILFSIVMRAICFENKPDVKRFVVVSGATSALYFYPIIGGPKCFYCVPKLDSTTKKKICRDIFSSRVFGMFGRRPYKLSAESNISRVFSRHQENYTSKEIVVPPIYETSKPDIPEHAFPCLVHEFEEIKKYFVSREYNINVETKSTQDYIAARFIFAYVEGQFRLQGLVEDAAKTAIFGTREQIENLYLRRRGKYLPTRSRIEDPLCKLSFAEKLRVCVAVFNSFYFDGVLEFPHSIIDEVDGICTRRTISFRTPHANAVVKAARRTFEEWTMSCEFPERKEKLEYVLSQAYKTNQIFVYLVDSYSGKVFPETISGNVRLAVVGNRLWDPDKSDVSYDDASHGYNSVVG